MTGSPRMLSDWEVNELEMEVKALVQERYDWSLGEPNGLVEKFDELCRYYGRTRRTIYRIAARVRRAGL